jgi:hypothetical protein
MGDDPSSKICCARSRPRLYREHEIRIDKQRDDFSERTRHQRAMRLSSAPRANHPYNGVVEANGYLEAVDGKSVLQAALTSETILQTLTA